MNFSTFFSYNLLPWQWTAWIILGLFIGLSKTGFNTITAVIIPVIALIFGARESTGVILPMLIFADIMAVSYYHREVEWKYVLKPLPWALAGFAAAIFADKLVPVQEFKYLMGGCIFAGLVVMIWNDYRSKENPPPSGWWFSALFGIAGGFSTMIGNVAGPIMAVYLLSMKLPKKNFVGTTAWFFFLINLLKLPIQIFFWNNITAKTLLFDVTLVPLIIIGAILGIFLVKVISESLYRKTVLILALISTVLLFVDFSKFIPG